MARSNNRRYHRFNLLYDILYQTECRIWDSKRSG